MSEQEVITAGVYEGVITWSDGEVELSRPMRLEAAQDWIAQRIAEEIETRSAAGFMARPSSQIPLI